jgi:hypothetical protein
MLRHRNFGTGKPKQQAGTPKSVFERIYKNTRTG